MDYKEIYRLVKEEIEAQGVPKSSWVWQDYLNDYDNFLWKLKRNKDIEKNNFESESESGMWWEYSSETSDMFDNIISTIEWLIKEGYFPKEYLV